MLNTSAEAQACERSEYCDVTRLRRIRALASTARDLAVQVCERHLTGALLLASDALAHDYAASLVRQLQ